ncbi:asparagine synthetase B, partial [Aquimarina celericrescens]|nr:asparagine synthetase B [Aquimarina celericrescens]
SILDLSDLGKQPMYFKNLSIVLNGEIYNYKNIQKELETLGYSFNSSSDTEVVLKSFHAWGMDCVKKFVGMFSFGIFDSQKELLSLCRDRLGVKPLYWYQDENQFIFGSELKVLFSTKTFSAKVDPTSLATFIN